MNEWTFAEEKTSGDPVAAAAYLVAEGVITEQEVQQLGILGNPIKAVAELFRSELLTKEEARIELGFIY